MNTEYCETRTLWVLVFAPGSCAASWRQVQPPSGRRTTLYFFFSHPPARDVRLCCGVLRERCGGRSTPLRGHGMTQ